MRFEFRGQQKIHPVWEKGKVENGKDTGSPVPNEIRDNLSDVKAEVELVMTSLQAFSQSSTKDIHDIKNIVDRTFDLVVDTRYKDGIQLIEAAYAVFIRGTTEKEIGSYIFELQTKAELNLASSRVRDYLKIIAEKDGMEKSQKVTEYIVLVKGQFLQIMVHYYISTSRIDMVTAQFEKFNASFKELEAVFEEVTGRPFKPGQKFTAAETEGGQMASLSAGDPLPAEEGTENLDGPQHGCRLRKKKTIFGVLSASVLASLAVIIVVGLLNSTGPPSHVELRSSGGAGEYEGHKLGVFQLLPDDGGKGGSQGPVYRQLHDGDNWQCYLYRAGDIWWVSRVVGVDDGYLKAKVVNKEDLLPPLNGWTYRDGGFSWQSDPTMTCSREVSPACSEVSIEISGRAQEKYPECAGRYLLMQGKLIRGRGVWQHASGAKLYLRVATGFSCWVIGSTIDGSDDNRIRSPSAGGHCPSDASNSISRRNDAASWRYYADDGWKKGDIRVI